MYAIRSYYAGPWYGGKYSSWEGGTRLPFIVSWPGRIEPSITDGLLSQVDVLASLLSIIGQKVPTGFCKDSQALEDLLLGKSDKGRESLIQQGVASKSIRCGDWKYIPHGVVRNRNRITSYNVCYTKLLRTTSLQLQFIQTKGAYIFT